MMSTVGRRAILAGAAGIAASGKAKAQSKPPTIRFGVLTDMSGQYSDVTGATGGVCARQAIADFGSADPVGEVILADHQQAAAIHGTASSRPLSSASPAANWLNRSPP